MARGGHRGGTGQQPAANPLGREIKHRGLCGHGDKLGTATATSRGSPGGGLALIRTLRVALISAGVPKFRCLGWHRAALSPPPQSHLGTKAMLEGTRGDPKNRPALTPSLSIPRSRRRRAEPPQAEEML